MNTSPSSRIPARVPLLLLVVFVGLAWRAALPARGENRIWTEPVQVSQAADSSIGGTLMRAPNDPFTLHVLFTEQNFCTEAFGNCKHYKGGHLEVDGDLEWNWEAREYFTYVPIVGKTGLVDVSALVDSGGLFHVLYECWEVDRGFPDLGYKVQGADNWSESDSAYIVAPYTLQCGGAGSPTLFLEEGDPDLLHLIHSRAVWVNPDSCPPGIRWVHRVRSMADPEDYDAWSEETIVTQVMLGQVGRGPEIVVDASHVVHLFGKIFNHPNIPQADTAWTIHMYGTPGTPFAVDTLDVYRKNAAAPDSLELADTIVAALVSSPTREPEEIDVAFTHYFIDDSTRSMRFCRITPGTAGFESVTVTPDGMDVVVPALGHTEADRVCLMFGEKLPAGGSRVLYTNTDADEAFEGGWSIPEPVIPDMQTDATGPSFVAIADSLWMLYHSGDDADGSDGGKPDLWFRKGVKMGAEATGDTTRWSGYVFLDRDYLVPSGKVLKIDAGTFVVAQADTDLANVGREGNRVELIVRGTLQVDGETEDRVRFESTDGDSGDWGGILFDVPATLEAAEYTTYGYCNSYVYYADVNDAQKGIAIRQTGAPSLLGLEFANNFKHRDVVLDSSDVYVPRGGTWNLLAPTSVKVADSTRVNAEIDSLHMGKVDLVVQGTLGTGSTSSAWVRFEPDSIPPSASLAGNRWGGIYLDWMTGTNGISRTDIGYAIAPLSLAGQGATVTGSRIHHFQDQAIWIGGSRSAGPAILGCTVFRDTTGTVSLHQTQGNKGIIIKNVTNGRIEGNRIILSGMNNSDGGAAVSVENTSGFCSATSAQAETLRVKDNTFLGPGGDASTTGTWAGIRGDWMCGASIRKVMVLDNALDGWNGTAFDLSQSADVQMTCNVLTNCARAIDFTRYADGTGVRYKANVLRIAEYGEEDDQQVIVTDNAKMLQLGPSTSSKGDNLIEATGEDLYAYENDEGAGDSLNARNNYWVRDNGPSADSAAVRGHISRAGGVSDAIRAYLGGILPDLEDMCSSGAHRTQVPQEELADEEGRGPQPTSTTEQPALPERTELVVGGPHSGRATIRFALAGLERRQVNIEVFDVAGRRVKSLVNDELAGGRYGIAWEGTAEHGERVGAGVYLVRMRAGAVTQVRKLVLLR